jgi:hypothetical protein
MVKKVPGCLHFHMKSAGLSFATDEVDVSHVVHQFSFGYRPSPRRMQTLARLHPGGLAKDWSDKLADKTFLSPFPEYTHEHFIQLIRTTLQPSSGGLGAAYDAFEYTAHSHNYLNEMAEVPAAKFSFHPSAMQVSPCHIVIAEPMQFSQGCLLLHPFELSPQPFKGSDASLGCM